MLAAVCILAALFLAHGMQCVDGLGHDPVAASHVMAPHSAGAPHGPILDDAVGVGSGNSPAIPPVGYAVDLLGAHGLLGHMGGVCVAVLTVGAMFWLLLARRRSLAKRGATGWPTSITSLVQPKPRWRSPSTNFDLLCVSRT